MDEATLRQLAEIEHNIDPTLFDDNGAYNATAIAEYLTWHYGYDVWLGDETHWIWTLTADLAATWQAARKEN